MSKLLECFGGTGERGNHMFMGSHQVITDGIFMQFRENRIQNGTNHVLDEMEDSTTAILLVQWAHIVVDDVKGCHFQRIDFLVYHFK